MRDHGTVITGADIFEEIEASGVEEVVARHGLDEHIDDGEEEVVVNHLLVVEFVVELHEISEEAECS